MTSSVQIQKDSKPEVSAFIHTELYDISPFNEIHQKNCPPQGTELFFFRSL